MEIEKELKSLGLGKLASALTIRSKLSVPFIACIAELPLDYPEAIAVASALTEMGLPTMPSTVRRFSRLYSLFKDFESAATACKKLVETLKKARISTFAGVSPLVFLASKRVDTSPIDLMSELNKLSLRIVPDVGGFRVVGKLCDVTVLESREFGAYLLTIYLLYGDAMDPQDSLVLRSVCDETKTVFGYYYVPTRGEKMYTQYASIVLPKNCGREIPKILKAFCEG